MKRVVIVIGIIVVIVFVLVCLRHQRTFLPSSATNAPTTTMLQNASNVPAGFPNRGGEGKQPRTVAADSRDALTRQFVENMRSDSNSMFKIKIRFYGKVIDETENPVAGANVGFTWNKLKSDGGFETGRAQTTSDGGGLFSLQADAESNGLDVNVSKPGYFAVRGDDATFEEAQPYAKNFLIPDQNNPVIFRLRKKANGVPLITSRHGMANDFSVAIPANVTPIKVNLLERKIGDGSLELSQVKPDPTAWKQASEWSFQMAIPDGGFVEYQDQEFPFEAPETGYQSVVAFDFKKDQPDWAEGVSRDYYIKFGNPPVYGRLHVETQIDLDGARLTYAVNPDGTRNLEPQ